MTSEASPSSAALPRGREMFGHPRGLSVLFMTEMWERFSYFGMSALLVLYMVQHLFKPGRVEHVIGYAAVKGALEALRGPLETQAFAAMLYSTYTAFAYLTPIVGGIIADRLLGQRRTVLIGACVMASAHFMLSVESLFLVALATLIVGNGLVKPNLSTQVGGLYRPDDPRIDRAYSIYYIGINIGAFLAPLVASTIEKLYGYRYGFIACGTGMLIGIAIYVSGWGALPVGQPARERRGKRARVPLSGNEKQAVAGLLAVCLIVTFFWATFDQQYHTVLLWGEFFTDRSIDLGFWRGEIPAQFFLSVNPLMIFIATPLVVKFWAWQTTRGSEPNSVVKMGHGFMFVATSYVIMVLAAWLAGPGGKAGWGWLFAYYAMLTIGELYMAPIGLALISKMAPARILSMMMGLWLATTFPGDLLGGWLASFWSSMPKTSFFMMLAVIAGVAGIAMWLFAPRLQQIFEREELERR